MYFKVFKTANQIEKNKNPYSQAKQQHDTSKHLRIYRLVVVVIVNAVIMHGLRSNVVQPIHIK